MNTTIKSVHFDADDLTKELIETRLERLGFADDKIVDLDVTLTKEKDHTFEVEAKIHFRWGVIAVVKETEYELPKCINDVLDKVDHKVRKEVDRMQDHKG